MLFSARKQNRKEATMSRRTCDVSSNRSCYTTDLRQAIRQYLPHSGLPLVVDDDKLRWVPRMLVTCAILLTWDLAGLLTDGFERARAVVVGMYPSRRRPGESYAGFIATLARQGAAHLAVVAPGLRGHVRRLAEQCARWRIGGGGGGGGGGWLVFGVDGSKLECPMTAANEAAFGTCGKKKTGPQQFLTTIFHVGTGLIWDFRRGDARASERAHLLEMLDTLPPDAMLLADAGFTGYELLARILHGDDDGGGGGGGGRSFILRVGANVRLLTKLGWYCEEHEGIVYLWPDKAQKKRQPPLVLRLITLVDGRNRRVHLLTSILDPRELSDGAAGELYRRRWGVELIYRSLKQTMGKRKLRCDAPANAAVELDWAVVGLWLLGLMSVERIIEAGHEPGAWSVAASLRIVRRAMAAAAPLPSASASPSRRGHQRRGGNGSELAKALAGATKDRYARTRPKTARHWPHKKKDKPPGDPRARMAEESEIQLATELQEKARAA
jgi:hypothetical protein